MNQVRNGAVGMGLQLPPPMALRMATIICAMVPLMCVYPFLQKYFTSGITPVSYTHLDVYKRQELAQAGESGARQDLAGGVNAPGEALAYGDKVRRKAVFAEQEQPVIPCTRCV